MRFWVRLGDREVAVDLVNQGNRFTLAAAGPDGTAGEPVAADVVAVQPGEKYSILLGRRSFAVSVGGDGRKMSLVVAGRAWSVEVEDERERASRQIAGAGPARGGVVESVMPGIVRDVHVKPGDHVQAGDKLLVLEAMKMENDIRADFGGIVEVVHVAPGKVVDKGERLVTLKGE